MRGAEFDELAFFRAIKGAGVRWFRRRYPTPAERLAYVRRAYARWQRTAGTARRTSRQE